MSLSRLLSAQQARLEALAGLLQSELAQLLEGSIDGAALERIARDKQQLLTDLETTETSRLAVQRKLGYSPDAAGARQAAEDAGCLAEWLHMLELADDTARANQRNGRLIDIRAQHNRQILDFLQGIAETRVYTAKGHPEGNSGRLNASA